MKNKFEGKSMQFFYDMMIIRFNEITYGITETDVKHLSVFLNNNMTGVMLIFGLTEYIKKHFDEYVKEYGDGSERLSDIDSEVVRKIFYKRYQEEIIPEWRKKLSSI